MRARRKPPCDASRRIDRRGCDWSCDSDDSIGATSFEPEFAFSMVFCRDVSLPWAERFVDDVVNRTETANPQAQTFLAMLLALEADRKVRRF